MEVLDTNHKGFFFQKNVRRRKLIMKVQTMRKFTGLFDFEITYSRKWN